MNKTHFLAIYHLSLVNGPSFTLEKHFRLFLLWTRVQLIGLELIVFGLVTFSFGGLGLVT